MPTSTGQLQLQDYDDELVQLGFDGIDATHRYRIINLAYRRIARRFPWLWEKTTQSVVVAPGATSISLYGATPDLPNFRSLDFLYITTDQYRRRLRPMNEQEYHEYWAVFDLTAATNRGIPDKYFIEDNVIYLIPPPQVSLTVQAHYHRRVSDMVNPSDVPMTPAYLDEAILLASKSSAHKRVYEIQLAAQAEADLNEVLGQMLEDEDWIDEQVQERVEPDNTWL